MAKLHEVLAVRQDRRVAANEVVKVCSETFGKPALFSGSTTIYRPDAETEEERLEGEKVVATSVDKELKAVFEAYIHAIDVEATVDYTNAKGSEARADVIIDGNIVLENVPAMSLMNLEKDLGIIKKLLYQIPILDPTKLWKLDDKTNLHVYSFTRIRTAKTPVAIVGVEATKEHPAQVQYYNKDIRTGIVVTRELSGEITPAKKQKMIDYCGRLIEAVKEARARANQVEAVDVKIGKKLLDAIWNV